MCRYIKAQTPRGLLAALVLCSLSLLPGPLARAQGFAHGFTQSSAAEAPGLAESSFSYKFENPRFIIPLLEVDVSADGSGQVRFKRGESDEIIDFNLKLTPATLARIRRLLES